MTQSRSSKLGIPLEKRIWSGKVIDVEPDVVHVLLKNCPWASKARVRLEDFPGGSTQGIEKGQDLSVFLTHPNHEKPKMWFGNARWANSDQNPWRTDPPRLGEKHYGVAARYLEDYAVFVRLDNGIDAFLHISKLPGRHRSIHESIHIGDRIGGEVVKVQTNLLQVDLDVEKLIQREEREERFRRKAASKSPEKEKEEPSTSLDTTKNVLPRLSSVYLGIIDDDHFFVTTLTHWLMHFGIRCRHIRSQTALRQTLLQGQETPTHILLDYYLGMDWDAKATQQLVSKSHIPTLMVSGAGAEAQNCAQRSHWPFLSKPFLITDLMEWLDTGRVREIEPEAAAADGEKAHSQHWFDSRSARQVQVRGRALLQELCEKTGCLGAIWFRRERAHVYRPRVWYGVDEASFAVLNRTVHQSAVASVIEQHSEKEEAVGRAGPLLGPAPGGANYLWAFPLPVEGMVSRCLVYYRADRFDEESKQGIQDYLPRMEDLAERLNLVHRLDEAEVFAAIGRASTGLVHELKGAAAPLAVTLDSLIHQNLTAEEIRQELVNISEDVGRIVRVAKTKLRLIRLERSERLSIKATVDHIVNLMKIQANELDCRLEVRVPDKELKTSLPPQVLEQALINLLDNALYHLKVYHRRWGRIVISISEVDDLKTPIHIEVRDNGPGMNAQQLEQAFIPRVSDKGNNGSGMGLYISRALLREIGGELVIKQSIRWLGSRLLIKLPVCVGTMQKQANHEE